jgi:RNA polymerase sigma-70 factor (ECF subfamily)
MSMQTLTFINDQELIAGLKAHEAQACEQLIADYADMVYRVCYRILQDPGDAEDAMQETFITVYRNIDSFRGDSKLSSWLYRVAANKSLSILRSRKRKQERNISLETDEGEELPITDENIIIPEELLLREENLQALQEALDAMSPKLRAAVILYELEDLSMKETAEALEISESAAKLRVHRGRIFLQQYLSQRLQESQHE